MHSGVIAALAFAVGVGSGVLSALAGVGGAVVTTPGIRALGAPPIIAVGSTVPAIIPSAITGSIRYQREGLILWRVALWCGLTGAVAAVGGVATSAAVDARWLMVATAVLVLWSSSTVLRRASTLRRRGHAGAANVLRPQRNVSRPVLALMGGVAGYVAGLLGVGGGIVMVPAFTSILRLPVKQTVATSLVAVALMSISSCVGHAIAGHIDWTFALPLVAGVVPGARLGSKVTVTVSEETAGWICGSLLAVIGMVYLVTEAVSLAS
jgi:uncharacterized membrane protein YfcA